MQLTKRDRQILNALCNHVRLFSLEQIAEHWWPGRSTALELASKRMARLEAEKLISCQSVIARPMPEISQPVVCWKPTQSEPDFGAAAWILQSRWMAQPQTTKVFLAQKSASKLFGGKATGELKRQYQATHDLGVAAMYLQMMKSDSELLQYWVGEDILAPHRRGQKLPDAVIATLPGSNPNLVLEFGGAYDKARLLEFHRDCKQRALPYEIW